MLQMIAPVFQYIERLVFNLPATACTACQLLDIVLVDRQGSDEGALVSEVSRYG